MAWLSCCTSGKVACQAAPKQSAAGQTARSLCGLLALRPEHSCAAWAASGGPVLVQGAAHQAAVPALLTAAAAPPPGGLQVRSGQSPNRLAGTPALKRLSEGRAEPARRTHHNARVQSTPQQANLTEEGMLPPCSMAGSALFGIAKPLEPATSTGLPGQCICCCPWSGKVAIRGLFQPSQHPPACRACCCSSAYLRCSSSNMVFSV